MAAIRYRVPYQLAVKAHDVASGKTVSNILYYRSGIQGAAPPAYGEPIAGASSGATLLAAVKARFEANIVPLLNANYELDEYQMAAMAGKRYSTPLNPILALVSSLNAIIVTAGPHGLATGAFVNVVGVTIPADVNGIWPITTIDPTSFSLDGTVPFVLWSGDGAYQLPGASSELLLADMVTATSAAVGGVVGEALPLYVTASVRRLNGGIGRNFRSRLSFSPMSEDDNLDGGWEVATKTAWAAALSTMFATGVDNGGSDAGSKLSAGAVVSKRIAMGLPTPFVQSASWCQDITGWSLQRNAGSLTRRKPRLTAVIA